jgi:hypothetical protein
MKKRIFLTAIWAYVAWYAAVLVAAFLGVTEAIGPIVGALVAAIVWFAPHGMPALRERSATSGAGFRARP